MAPQKPNKDDERDLHAIAEELASLSKRQPRITLEKGVPLTVGMLAIVGFVWGIVAWIFSVREGVNNNAREITLIRSEIVTMHADTTAQTERLRVDSTNQAERLRQIELMLARIQK